jgi:membrane-associated PAP2 superfamily phosphatase
MPEFLQRRSAFWLVPLALLTAGTLAIRIFDLDMRIAHRAFAAGNSAFATHNDGAAYLLYHLTPWPAFLLAIVSLVVIALSFARPAWQDKRRAAFVLLAAIAIGPGLIINTVLKPHFGRPRPSQVEAFGGTSTYLPVLHPGPEDLAHSFPSGHAAIAYALLTPFFILRHRMIARLFLALGLAWGTLIGTMRILQGGHWLSDVLWAAAIVYLTGWALARATGLMIQPVPNSR